MLFNKKTLVLLSSLLLTNVAQADLVTGDWISEGDSQVTIDTDTGVEWLKLNNTSGMSVNQVIAELGSDGDFEGWRLPTESEVQTLIETVLPQLSWNGIGESTVYSSGAYRGYADIFRSWLGTSSYVFSGDGSANRRYWYSYGNYVDSNGQVKLTGTYRYQKYTWGKYDHSATMHDNYYPQDFTMDSTNSTRGVFLVSDGGVTLSSINDPMLNVNNPNSPAKVSTPFAFGLTMLIGMAAIRRRKK